ncbi:MAG: hypothetical protein O7G85_03815 [Planctomycetota bacterium]|nr:hypothetical protein [Planctomycetota bacterium]
MPSSQAITIGASLMRLRRAIFLCCCAIGLGLFAQLSVWALISYTDIRWTEDETALESPLIIQSDTFEAEEPDSMDDPAQAIRAVASATGETIADESNQDENDEAASTLILSRYDKTLSFLTRCAKGFGTVGMIIILPMLMLSVLITAGTALRGGEKIVGAFNLGLVLGILVLPLGETLSLPWSDGALTSYETMTRDVDGYATGPVSAIGPFVYYAQYFMLPLACMMGTALLYLRYSGSVELAILQGDTLRVDPDIEEEASGVKVGARGNRASNALNRLSNDPHQKVQAPLMKPSNAPPQPIQAQPMQNPQASMSTPAPIQPESPDPQITLDETPSNAPRRII